MKLNQRLLLTGLLLGSPAAFAQGDIWTVIWHFFVKDDAPTAPRRDRADGLTEAIKRELKKPSEIPVVQHPPCLIHLDLGPRADENDSKEQRIASIQERDPPLCIWNDKYGGWETPDGVIVFDSD